LLIILPAWGAAAADDEAMASAEVSAALAAHLHGSLNKSVRCAEIAVTKMFG